MKCSQIIKKFGHLRREDLPADIRALVDSDAECREWFMHTDTQRDLVRLKLHERPAPEVHGRIVYHVRTRIEAGESLPVPELRTPRSALTLQITTVAVVLFAGTGVYLSTQLGNAEENGGGNMSETFVAAPTEGEDQENAQVTIESLFRPMTTESTYTNLFVDNTNSSPWLPPSKPGPPDYQRISAPPQKR